MSYTTPLQRKRDMLSRDVVNIENGPDDSPDDSEVPNQQESSIDWKSASMGAAGAIGIVILICCIIYATRENP